MMRSPGHHLLLLAMLLLAHASMAQDLGLEADGGVAGDELEALIADVKAEQRGPLDLDQLVVSHWSETTSWTGVRPLKHAGEGPWHWREVASPGRTQAANRSGISPLGDGAASTTLAVPAAGRYRIWLCYRVLRGRSQPVQLALSGATTGKHDYGATAVTDESGAAQEAAGPVRFDTALAREIRPPDKSLVWEYWDAELAAGETVVSLTAPAGSQAAVTDFFITQSMDFVPSRDVATTERNLDRIWYRVRVMDAPADAPERCPIGHHLLYRARHPLPSGKGEGLYQGRLNAPETPGFQATDGEPGVPVGEWSAWLDATPGSTNGGGPATLWIDTIGVTAGRIEVEIAWTPHEAAVLARATGPISGGVNRFNQAYGVAMFMAPVDTRGSRPPTVQDGAVWGMRPPRYLAGLEDIGAVEARIGEAIATATEGRSTGLTRLRLLTHANPPDAAADATWRNLRALGLTWVSPPPPAAEAYGLLDGESLHALGTGFMPRVQDPGWRRRLRESWATHAERREEAEAVPVLCVKLGDEVGMATNADRIAGDPDALADFHAFVAWELARRGEGPDFLGVERVTDLAIPDGLPALSGRYDRRLRWFAWRYLRFATAAHYAKATAAVRAAYPGADTYVNLSPGFMFGQTHHSLWFDLPRSGATTLAWAEDWAWPTGGTATTGLQTVGFYGAMLACAARPGQRPIGFYTVAASGNPDRKMFSLLPYRVFWQNLYSYGPAYLKPGQSDGWSSKSSVIQQIARATTALAPAEARIVDGVPAPARTAILVNLTDDLWQQGRFGTLSDRLLTFIALRHAHLPVDLILEDDLTAAGLAPYRVLHLNGANLPRATLAPLQAWVEAGGTLVATAPVALRDEFDEPLPEAEALLGVRQRLTACSTGSWHSDSLPEHAPVGRLTVRASDLTPALQDAPIIGPRVVLELTSARDHGQTDTEVLGNWADGSIAITRRIVGRGEVVVNGYAAGLNYRATAPRDPANKARITGWTAERRGLVTRPTLSRAGAPMVAASEAQVDVGVFQTDRGLAITLTDYTWRPGEPLTLRLRPPAGRTPTNARSTTTGALTFIRDGDEWLVQTTIPEPLSVILVDW